MLTPAPRMTTYEFDKKLFKFLMRRKFFTRQEIASFLSSIDSRSFRKRIDYRLRVFRTIGAAEVFYNQTLKRFEVLNVCAENYVFNPE